MLERRPRTHYQMTRMRQSLDWFTRCSSARGTLAGREQPGRGKTNLRGRSKLLVSLHCAEDAQRVRHEIDDFSGPCRATYTVFCRKPATQHHQELIDQVELPFGSFALITGQVVQDGAELAREDVDQQLGCTALERQDLRASGIQRRERPGEALRQQQVVSCTRSRHVVMWATLQARGRAARWGRTVRPFAACCLWAPSCPEPESHSSRPPRTAADVALQRMELVAAAERIPGHHLQADIHANPAMREGIRGRSDQPANAARPRTGRDLSVLARLASIPSQRPMKPRIPLPTAMAGAARPNAVDRLHAELTLAESVSNDQKFRSPCHAQARQMRTGLPRLLLQRTGFQELRGHSLP